MEYEWDEYNLRELQFHGVQPQEAIEALEDPDALDLAYQVHRSGEFRYPVAGETSTGRVLTVVWTERGPKTRIITAFDAEPEVSRWYRNKGRRGDG